MLAPVLARLSEIPGVIAARVECSGSWFFVEAQSAAALDDALPAIRNVLGSGATLADGAAREAQLARRSQGELWFSRSDIRALSYVEGRVLATRMVDAITGAVTLDASALDEVGEATRAEIFAALDHAHDTGGRASSGWFWEEWPRIVDRIAARLERSRPAAPVGAIAEALRAQGP